MKKVYPGKSSVIEVYKTMIGSIIPRPIAWVSTRSIDRGNNLAPYSAFNLVTSNPATLMFTVVNDKNGRKKDTLRNIEENPHFVVNSVSYSQLEEMKKSSGNFDKSVSEFDLCNVAQTSAEVVDAPMVKDSKVKFECKLHDIYRIGSGANAGNVIFGRIALIHVCESILDEQGHILSEELDAVGRLGRDYNIRTKDIFR